jgi:hypothetical protein
VGPRDRSGRHGGEKFLLYLESKYDPSILELTYTYAISVVQHVYYHVS